MIIKKIKVKQTYTRNFGYLLTFIFSIICLYPILNQADINLWAAVLSLVFFVITIFFNQLLVLPAYLWMQLGKLLHLIISPIILFLVYFFSIIIVGLLLKIFGKDPLDKKYNLENKSYWVEKKKNLEPKDLFNQF